MRPLHTPILLTHFASGGLAVVAGSSSCGGAASFSYGLEVAHTP